MAKFFAIPFAASASRSTIPDTDSTSVSWNGGYTVNYEYNPLTNKQAKHIERDLMNTLFYEITSTLQQIQLSGCAPYYEAIITATGPGYSEGALVSYGGNIWRSKTSNNKVIPNANSTDNWEIVYGYSTLVTQLSKDGYLGGGSGDGYSKDDIDRMIKDLNIVINSNLIDSAYYILGEIYLLSWCDEDRNGEGFFLCNGDTLPYIPEGEEDPGTDPLTYYGNQLYDLCYTTDDSGTVLETAFKKRWNIKIDESNKTIQLPNILGLRSDGSITSETDHMLLALGKTSAYPDVSVTPNGLTTGSNDNLYFFKMLPCIYLGVDTDSSTTGE